MKALRFTGAHWQALAEVATKEYRFTSECDTWVDVQQITQGLTDGHHVVFTLHRRLVPEDQVCCFEEVASILAPFDIIHAGRGIVEWDLEPAMGCLTAVKKCSRNARRRNRQDDLALGARFGHDGVLHKCLTYTARAIEDKRVWVVEIVG